MPSEKETKSFTEQVRASRRGSPLAGFGDRTGHWSVSISLGLLAVVMVISGIWISSWQFTVAGVLFAVGGASSWFAMKRGEHSSLLWGVIALALCVGGVALVISAPR